MPEHMKNGPRNYSDEYDYKRAFKYFDSLNDVALLSGDYDNHNATITAHDSQNVNDVILKIADSDIFNQVEEELQRIHHGENVLQNADVFVNPYMPI